MLAVDLNADLAEGETLTPSDVAILDAVTSVSIACGFHAGNRMVMQATARECVHRGLVIGAHVSYRDREGFGRRVVHVDPAQLVDDILEQCTQLAEAVGPEGGTVSYVKPHGALYNQLAVDEDVAGAVAQALAHQAIDVLVAQSGGATTGLGRRAGLRVVPEGFPDRAYLPDGRLAPRGVDGAVLTDPDHVSRRALSLVDRGGVEATTGEWTRVPVETLCIHGDAPGAARTARAVRDALRSAGVTVRPFVESSGSVADTP